MRGRLLYQHVKFTAARTFHSLSLRGNTITGKDELFTCGRRFMAAAWAGKFSLERKGRRGKTSRIPGKLIRGKLSIALFQAYPSDA